MDSLSIEIETKEVEAMLQGYLRKLKNPKKLMKVLKRVVLALTRNMFTASPRPDTKGRRGVKWPKLKQSTINRRKAILANPKSKIKLAGKATSRPMVMTGKLRDSIKVLEENKNGFVIGTKEKTKKGFAYPGHHNKGRFPFLFLSKQDFVMFQSATIDFLQDRLKGFKSYMKE